MQHPQMSMNKSRMSAANFTYTVLSSSLFTCNHTYTHVAYSVVNSVIGASVSHFLCEPSSPAHTWQPDSLQRRTNGKVARADVYGLLLPDKADSPRIKQKLAKQKGSDSKVHQQDKSSDIMQDVSVREGVDEPDSGEHELDVTARIGSDVSGRKEKLISSRKVSKLVQQFDETDSGDIPEDTTKVRLL